MRARHFARVLVIFVCVGSLAVMSHGLYAQSERSVVFDATPIQLPAQQVTLLAKESPATARLLPPPGEENRIQSSTFIVNYKGFSPAARAAFQRAVDIWSSEISSPVPIVIDANWSPLGAGVLGSAGPNDVFLLTDSSQQATAYPVALANALVGKDLDTANADISADFNSNLSNWYLGTDGNAPPNTYDLVTVVIHEIGHGLGFVDSTAKTGTTGRWGISGYPLAYDRFVVNNANQQIINTALFPNPSTALGNQFTSDQLFFNGPNASAAAGAPPKLFAPTTWREGSSIAHLDEDAFPVGSADALMTPALDDGEVIHVIGPIVEGMFRDLGWRFGGEAPPTNTVQPSTATRTRTGTAMTPTSGTTATTQPGGTRRNYLPVVKQVSSNSASAIATTTSQRTATQSPSATRSPTPSATITRTQTQSGTMTQTGTVTQASAVTQTRTPSVTNTVATATATRTATNTLSPTRTSSPTRVPTNTQTPTSSRTPSVTPTAEGT